MKSMTCPTGKPGSRQTPIGQVAEHAAEQQSEHDGPQPGAHARRGEPDDDHRDDGQRDREDPGDALAERERGTGVADQVEDQEVADDVDRLLGRQVLEGEVLRELISGQHQHRENRDDGAGRRRTKWRTACQRPAYRPMAETGVEPEVVAVVSRSRSLPSM